MQGKNRYILTLLGRKLTAQQIAGATKILANQGLNIDAIRRLTGRVPLDEQKASVRACIEFSVRGTPRDIDELQGELMRLSSTLEMDFSFQKRYYVPPYAKTDLLWYGFHAYRNRSNRRTGERAGVGEQVQEITERAMRGEIDFRESFKERVALLKGLDESVMKDIAENLLSLKE